MDNEIKETDMNNLPKDPVMLLSVVNTNLRDFYSNLDEFCKAKDADKQEIIEKLKMIEYTYDEEKNQFMCHLIKDRLDIFYFDNSNKKIPAVSFSESARIFNSFILYTN